METLYSQFQHSFTALQWGVREEVRGWEGAGVPYRAWGRPWGIPEGISLQLVGRTLMEQIFTLHTGTGGHGPKEAASMESPHRSRALEEAVGLDMRTMPEQVYPEGQQPWVKTHAGGGRSVRWKKWQRGTVMDWLQPPFSSYCAAQWGYGMEEVEKLGREKQGM